MARDAVQASASVTEQLAPAALLKLMTWLSPAFPVGSFSYSHGLESAAAGSWPTAPEDIPIPNPSPQGGGGLGSGSAGVKKSTILAKTPATASPPFCGEGRGGGPKQRQSPYAIAPPTRGGGRKSPNAPGANDRPGGSLVTSAEDLRDWLAALLRFGSGWNDAVLFAEAWRRQRDSGSLAELAGLGAALAGSRERHLETTLQGAAFASALRNAWPAPPVSLPEPCPYPVAVGAACGAHWIDLEAALAAYLQAFVANLAQASIRLGVTGQSDAVGLVAALEPVVTETAMRAAQSSLDDLGSAAILSEIMSMRHETHYSRLFRT